MVCGFDKSVECTRKCKYFDTCTRNELLKKSSTSTKVKQEVETKKTQEVEATNDNEWMMDILFEDDIEKRIQEELLKYSSIGLYVNQISELLSIHEEKIKKILSGATWCRVEKKRYFYNETSNTMHTSKPATKETFCGDTPNTAHISEPIIEETLHNDSIEYKHIRSLTNEDKFKMMNDDIEGLLKRLKAEKGIN